MIQEAMSTEAFQQYVSTAKQPILIDFFSRACAPCKALASTLEKFVVNHPFSIIKIDIEIASEVARNFKVRSVPTLLVVENSKVLRSFTGNASEAQILKLIEG